MSQAPQATNVHLDSWKSVAEYLRRDVTTLMRWEKEKGLPVHRLPGGRRQAVFAYVAELDAWMASFGPRGADHGPDAGSPAAAVN